jgi:phenylalanyl-tRNA synthetase beta chain
MNISYRWLQAIAPGISGDPREISDRLGMLGAPVDELTPLAGDLCDILIARIEEVRSHPNADRLRLCTVNAGGAALQVVCGAPNVEAGRFYPFAPVGASLPGGIQIKKAKLRGEVSEGMLCSARELGLGREHEGLMTLSGEWAPGSSFVDELALDDWRLVVDVTPNRPDLLSHIGVAREVDPRGVSGIELTPFTPGFVEPTVERGAAALPGARVVVENPEGCPRYMAAVLRGVRVGPSPEWLASRLRAVGLRPINNVVDATNYVLHELGQPLHAFDLGQLAGPEIRVRSARAGESLRTLDGFDRELSPEMLVIADSEKPVAVAGVMGGEESEVTEETADILLECARFDEKSVRRTARALGLSTDASYRFERGVDPFLQPKALARVLDLVQAVAGGRLEGGMLDVAAAPPAERTIDLRPERVARLLGVEVDATEIEGLLTPIGFDVSGSGSTLQVGVPGYRPDVEREVDLIEEIARRRGYDSFPENRVAFRASVVPEDRLLGVERRVRAVLERWGLLEARTAAFAPAGATRIPLLNPLSSEESHLRDALGPGLLRRVEHNWAHGVRDVRLYEIGTVFFPDEQAPGGAGEEIRVAAVLTGSSAPAHWTGEARPWDLWDLKALLAELSRELGAPGPVPAQGEPSGNGRRSAGPSPLLAARTALEVRTSDDRRLGGGGQVRDKAIDAPAWAEPVWLLEMTLVGASRGAPTYQPLPEYPPAERDLALLVPSATSADQVERVIRGTAGDSLAELWPFDLYEGPGIAEGTRSIAWRLRFRRPDRTLTDEEVDRAIASVLGGLQERLGVERR